MKGLSNFSQFAGLFANKDYRWYVVGNFASTIGLWMQRVAMGWLVYELTHDPAWLGIIALAEIGPTIVLGFLSGALLERLNPLKALRITQVMTVTYSSVLAALTLMGLMNEWLLLVLVLLRGFIFTINRPARMTIVYNLVGRNLLPNALAINATIFNSSKFIGPALAGPAIRYLGVGETFIIVVLMQLVFTYSLASLKLETPARLRDSDHQTNLGEEIIEGLRYIAQHPGIRLQFALLFMVALLAKPVSELFPAIAKTTFGQDANGLAWMFVLHGIGAMAGGVWLSLHGSLVGLVIAGISATILTSISLLLFSSTQSFGIACALLMLVGFGSVVVGISSQTLIQSAIRSRYRGRTMSTYGMVAQGGPALGALIMGNAANSIGLQAPIFYGALACLLIGSGAWMFRKRMAALLEGGHEAHERPGAQPARALVPATETNVLLPAAPTLAAGLPIRFPHFTMPAYINDTWKTLQRMIQAHQHRPDAATIRLMGDIGAHARTAGHELALAPTAAKNRALTAAAEALRAAMPRILAANDKDVAAAREAGRPESYIDRLRLDEARVEEIAKGLEEIARLPDPVGTVLADWTRPNGMRIERVRVPIGVIGIIYESRPNVTADAGALCLKSGNAVILRGGSESHYSSVEIHDCLVVGLRAAGLPAAAIQLVPTTDRSAVGLMLGGLDGTIDVIVPRGGKSLVARVQDAARVPVFAHLEGICHTYVDRDANLDMAKSLVLNAKLRRTGVCGATETLLIDRNATDDKLGPLVRALLDAGCEVRGDVSAQAVDDRVKPATEADWSTEYLDKIISVKLVDGVAEAIGHIARYGSRHTDCIVTEDASTAVRFLTEVDSAIVLHNASTQFADGGEFGFGAEIGIATGKLHARGPVGVEQLTSFKYVVHGTGQTRPG